MKHFFTLLITLTFSAFALAQAPADLVLVNGKIWTVDDRRPEVEAVAILGNRIAATGSSDVAEILWNHLRWSGGDVLRPQKQPRRICVDCY
jgi:hypothetical protein